MFVLFAGFIQEIWSERLDCISCYFKLKPWSYYKILIWGVIVYRLDLDSSFYVAVNAYFEPTLLKSSPCFTTLTMHYFGSKFTTTTKMLRQDSAKLFRELNRYAERTGFIPKFISQIICQVKIHYLLYLIRSRSDV